MNRGRVALLAVAALLGIAGLDALLARPLPRTVIAVLDEPAHLLTAALLLAAAGVPAGLARWALVGAVAIDVDHIPLYLWGGPVAAPGGRPVTHSLATVAVLLLLGALLRGRGRTAALGLGLGVVLHLLRDTVSAPGVPLFWPLAPVGVRLPYLLYAALLVAAAAVAGARRPRATAVSDGGGGR